QNQPDGFYVPATSTTGFNPKTSSVSVLDAPKGDGSKLQLLGSIYQGHELDDLFNVGDTHPSATAIIHHGSQDVLYVAKSNSDSLGIIRLHNQPGQKSASLSQASFGGGEDEDDDSEEGGAIRKERDFDLSPVALKLEDGHSIHGAYPNAIVASPDNERL